MRKSKIIPTSIVGQFTINGKPIQITDSWAKTTFGQYLRIMKLKNDTIELLSIITGLEYDYLKKAKITGIEKLLVASGFINSVPDIPTQAKKIGGFKLPLNSKGIFDIQFESLAQFEDMRMIMGKTDMKDPIALTESYATYCAIYVQKLRDGEYDGEKAMGMVPEIHTCPAFDVISAGSFFLTRLWILLNGTQKKSPSTTQTQTTAIGKRTKKRSGLQPRSTKRAKR